MPKLLIAAGVFGVLIVAGFARVHTRAGLTPRQPASKQESVRENQAVTTQLGANATAVSYWAGGPDGWHVVTTDRHRGRRRHRSGTASIVRFSAH